MTPIITSTATSLLPQGVGNTVADHYQKYQHIYNPALIGLAGTALYKGVNALTGDDDDDRPRRGRSGGGLGSWLLPMAILGGGAYLWNKYGDDIKNGLTNLKQFSSITPGQKKDLETAAKIGHVVRRSGQIAGRTARTFWSGGIPGLITDKNRDWLSYVPVVGDFRRVKKIWTEPWD